MIIYTKLDTYNTNYIFFGDIIKNTVITNGKFIRIIYSNKTYTLNGLYILVPLVNIKKINSSTCSINNNNSCIKNLCNIEKDILGKYITSKTKEYKLQEQLNKNIIKIFNSKNTFKKIIIKISGLWEDDNSCGLTYKFINY
jgi:hypothetical protein|tara:strand:+ start:705 stop:1127 length:423 start_codon:yes stop_codon:yes gene_type:complete